MRKNMIAILSSTSSDVAKPYPCHYGSNESWGWAHGLSSYNRGIFRNYSENMN
eukprot:CAMPEP_0170083284 /NCGR_PEP_ID=MMETSP0019_2-20121128/18672_1 /TAXON_ID=98059 /ORGANISM="Dinobryon sp., Strain UTEXLB2267" /LENGTH=52 /DNA_ID=CAMNT_0010298601 /DNA_START=855 /DNA_END=1013 /DNA_ORIENTATION=+